MQVGLLQKLMFLVFLSLLASTVDTQQLPLSQNESSISLNRMNNTRAVPEISPLSQNEGSISLIGMNERAASEMKQRRQEQEQQQQQRVAHSLDEFFPSKRRVPNASDPLHNR